MASNKPSVPKGTRDFSPTEMVRRNFIFDTIKSVFRKYGYQQIETPAMENLSTLLGKYGDEGDKLIFKVLNNGDLIDDELLSLFKKLNKKCEDSGWSLKKISGFPLESDVKKGVFTYINPIAPGEDINDIIFDLDNKWHLPESLIEANKILASKTTEKALRYDLTVPFARYVVQHQNEITFPFKRFQVQPVWRADRPQKGRYREFYQCDADVVGSDSLLNEAEFVMIYDEALSKLGLKDFTIKINNRKILYGIAETIDKIDMLVPMTIAIDKLDKIGVKGVNEELQNTGFDPAEIVEISSFLYSDDYNSNYAKLEHLRSMFGAKSPTGLKGCDEIETVLNYIANCPLQTANLELDITLARGLNYYTGAIFEVKTNEVAMGSIGGGGRYDDLTGMFGLSGLTGVGISFGADRIYDVMEELNLFPAASSQSTRLLICCFDKEGEKFALPILQQLRNKDISAELYPAGAKLKKQLDYANNKNIPFTIIIGSEEIESGLLTIKNMETGVQEKRTVEDILESFV